MAIYLLQRLSADGYFRFEIEHDYKQQQLKSFFTQEKERYTFYFDLDPQQHPIKVDIYMRASTLMEDALLLAIDALNEQFKAQGISIRKDIALYKARLTGKQFKPKTDLPALSLYQKICDLKVSEIAVQLLNRQHSISKVQKHNQTHIVQSQSPQKNVRSKEKQKAGQEGQLTFNLAKMQLSECLRVNEGDSK